MGGLREKGGEPTLLGERKKRAVDLVGKKCNQQKAG